MPLDVSFYDEGICRWMKPKALSWNSLEVCPRFESGSPSTVTSMILLSWLSSMPDTECRVYLVPVCRVVLGCERTLLVYGPPVLMMFIRSVAPDYTDEVIVVKFCEQTARPMPYPALSLQ